MATSPKPTPRLLLGPGPCDAHPRVIDAMATPLLGHLDPQFLGIMDETAELCRKVFLTKNALTFPVPGTGSAGMEACFFNLVEPGDKVVVAAAGYFGNRMIEMAERSRAEVAPLTAPWGTAFDPAEIRETLKAVRPKLLAIVNAETSTGVHQPLDEIGALCREYDALFLVDCVTSLGCTPVKVDDWHIDAAYSCSQKGLGCPPGLAPLTFSDRAVAALKARKTKPQSWYLDLNLLQQYWGTERMYHHTAPISSMYALREGLNIVVEEGLEPRWDRHVRNHRALKAGLEAIGLDYIADSKHQLPQLNAVRIPAGIEDVPTRKRLLLEHGIEIGGGLGEFKGRAWRIGLMGYNSRPDVVKTAISAIEQVIGATAGSGVAAADAVYSKE